MSRDLGELLKRQIRRHEAQLREFEPPDGGPDDWEWPDAVTDEQLATLRAEMDAAFGPGTADRLLGAYQGPMPEWWLKALANLPDALPATRDEFLETHERMRRLVGDLRARPPQMAVEATEVSDERD